MSKFQFTKLDAQTRALMREEITQATKNGQLYFSTRFTEAGKSNWSSVLLEAATAHDEHWLAYQLEATDSFQHVEVRARPTGGYTTAHVPGTAAETLADGQFNRFYIAAICRRAIAAEKVDVTIYRAKQRSEPRSESQSLEGTSQNAETLLREVQSRDTSLRCALLKPNSGLSVDY